MDQLESDGSECFGQVIGQNAPRRGVRLLSATIRGVLCLSVLMSAISPSVGMADTTTLQTVPAEYIPEPDWPEWPSYPPSDPGDYGDGDGGGGGSGGGGNGDTGVPCAILATTKPAQCPNPIPMPSGAGYGVGIYPGGTAIAKANYFINHQSGVSPAARNLAIQALEQQTREFASRNVPYSESLSHFKYAFFMACGQQSNDDAPVRAILGNYPTAAEQQCLSTFERIRVESNDQDMSFVEWFSWWTQNEGLPLSDLGIPQPVVDLFSPDNSIKLKYDKVTSDATCATWWEQAQAQQCSF